MVHTRAFFTAFFHRPLGAGSSPKRHGQVGIARLRANATAMSGARIAGERQAQHTRHLGCLRSPSPTPSELPLYIGFEADCPCRSHKPPGPGCVSLSPTPMQSASCAARASQYIPRLQTYFVPPMYNPLPDISRASQCIPSMLTPRRCRHLPQMRRPPGRPRRWVRARLPGGPREKANHAPLALAARTALQHAARRIAQVGQHVTVK